MQKFLVGFLLVIGSVSAVQAQDGIQTFVNNAGKIVFTNSEQSNAPMILPTLGAEVTLLRNEMPASILPLVETISNTHGVDPNLVSAVMKTESNFNQWAVSPKGARGLMQLIPATGHRFGVQDFFDPRQNIEGAVRYLKFLLEKFDGNVELSLAAYNAGENLVQRLGRVPSITETRNYVRKISAMYNKPAASVTSPSPATQTAQAAVPPPPPIYRNVDQRGVVHFSNIGPLD